MSSAGDALPYTVELHRFVLVRQRAATVQSFLLAHVPAGMTWAGDGLGSGTTNTITVLWVGYSPRSVASGLTNADLGANAMPLAGGGGPADSCASRRPLQLIKIFDLVLR